MLSVEEADDAVSWGPGFDGFDGGGGFDSF